MASFAGFRFDTNERGTYFASYFFSGDPSCSLGPDDSFANSCGVRIHINGASTQACTNGNLGEPLFTGSSDPWSSVTYGTMESSSVVTASAGFSYDLQTVISALSKSLVIYDRSGVPIACTYLIAPLLTPIFITPGEISGLIPAYVDYLGDVSVFLDNFQIHMIDFDGSVYMSWDSIEADNRCNGVDVPVSVNSCGIHLHTGSDCNATGGHLFRADTADPWEIARYISYEGGASGSVVVRNVDFFDSGVATLVVHDADGVRVACYAISGSQFNISLTDAPTEPPTTTPTIYLHIQNV